MDHSPRLRALREVALFGTYFFLALVAGSLVARALGMRATNIVAVPMLAAELVVVGLVLPAVVYLQRRRGARLSDLGLVIPADHLLREIGVGVAAGLVVKLATIPIGIVAYLFGARGGLQGVRMHGSLDLLVFVLAGTLAAVAEEIVFRGYLRDRLAVLLRDPRRGGSIWPTGVATSLAFGLGHGYEGAIGLVVTTCVGLLLFLVVILPRTTLFHAIVAHAVFNATSFLTLAAWTS